MLGQTLKSLKGKLGAPGRALLTMAKAIDETTVPDGAKPYLLRMRLDQPRTLGEKMARKLIVSELVAQGHVQPLGFTPSVAKRICRGGRGSSFSLHPRASDTVAAVSDPCRPASEAAGVAHWHPPIFSPLCFFAARRKMWVLANVS